MKFQYNDGGRQAAGYRGKAGDCVCRAVAIASGLPYRQVYDALNQGAFNERGRGTQSRARTGVRVQRQWFKTYLTALGWKWIPTMGIGTGCQVHLAAHELPPGRLIVALSRHYTCVIDHVIHDTHDPSRLGARCVYGYWHQ
jgi:hypothetical protein